MANAHHTDRELFATLARVDAEAAPILAKRKGSWVPPGPWAGLADSMDAAKAERLEARVSGDVRKVA